MRLTFKIRSGDYMQSHPVKIQIDEDRIYFTTAPYAVKDEIKALTSPRWHGFDSNPRKIWSVANTPGNCFRIKALSGEDVYSFWENNLKLITNIKRPLLGQQIDMVSRGLQYHFQIWAAAPGLGKSLAAIELCERSGKKNWWYSGPLSALESVEREIKKWKMCSSINLKMMSYEGLIKIMRYGNPEPPDGIILDESSLIKNAGTHRYTAAQDIADLIREKHGFSGYVILMSGTPSAKSPLDLWSQLEVAWPGFLREGSPFAFESRYAQTSKQELENGTTFIKNEGWIEEEVAQLPDRYRGLMEVYTKEDWLDLPEKKYEIIRLEPSEKVLRVARSLCNIAPNAISAMTACRALSSGFQYTLEADGVKECEVCNGTGKYSNPEPMVCPGCNGSKEVPDYTRKMMKVETPKDEALRGLLDRCEPSRRIVIAGAFQGSIDKILEVCKSRGWAVACIDGRGWRCFDNMGKRTDDEVMDFWENHPGKVAFVGNPESCGFGLTLTLADTLVFWENSFKAEKRLQMTDRIHRISMDVVKGATIIDLVHLSIDQLVLDTLKSNRKLELLSLGVLTDSLGEGNERN